jgi:hypothetical protein
MMAVTCWADARVQVNQAADMARGGNPVEAVLLLNKAINSGELDREDLITAYRNRAASNLLVFKQAFPLGRKTGSDKDKEIVATACALGLAQAKRDAEKVLAMAPGDPGAKTILTTVNQIVGALADAS